MHASTRLLCARSHNIILLRRIGLQRQGERERHREREREREGRQGERGGEGGKETVAFPCS